MKISRTSLFSALITYAVVLIWPMLFCYWTVKADQEINSAGLILYEGILIIIGIPFALTIGIYLAPRIKKMARSCGHALLLNTFLHGAFLLCSYLLFLLMDILPPMVGIFIIPFYLGLFLTPPSFIGCLIYLILPLIFPKQQNCSLNDQ